MLIYVKEIEMLIVAVEGTGDNLTAEDEADGLKDYMMTTLYAQDGDQLIEQDAGQMMTSKELSSLETDEIVELLMDYWGYNKDAVDYAVLNN